MISGMWRLSLSNAVAGAVVVSLIAASPAASSESMGVTGWANPPVGHVAFCKTFPLECEAHGPAEPVALTSRTWAAIEDVNRAVNRAIAPQTDLEIYREEEVWTLPDGRGDCEDYVLLKRKRLIAQGWPTGALLVTVVFDEIGEGHAVLLVRTTAGDFTLDNKTDAVRLWNETGYHFVKRQSDTDPRKWVSVGTARISSRNATAAQ